MKVGYYDHYKYAYKYPGKYRAEAARRPRAFRDVRKRAFTQQRAGGIKFVDLVPYRGDVLPSNALTWDPLEVDLAHDMDVERDWAKRSREGVAWNEILGGKYPKKWSYDANLLAGSPYYERPDGTVYRKHSGEFKRKEPMYKALGLLEQGIGWTADKFMPKKKGKKNKNADEVSPFWLTRRKAIK